MIIFTESREEGSTMSYEEFQNKALQSVRTINHLDLVDTWEKHIIHKEFSESNSYGTSYYGNVFFAEECQTNEPIIRIYEFSYHETYGRKDSASYYCIKGSLYKEEIEVLSKFAQCLNMNKGRFFSCTLDAFHKAEPKFTSV